MQERIFFVLKVVGLGALLGVALTFTSGACGLFLYTVLDSRMSADQLATFSRFLLPALVIGGPSVFVMSRLLLLRRHGTVQAALAGATVLLGTLGFAGFWVGAMGI